MNNPESFKEKGFVVVRGLMTSPKKLYEYTLQNKPNNTTGDIQSPNTPSFYNDERMMKHQVDMLPLMEKHTGLKLFKTYNYYRTYKRGDILKIHLDRPACEISVTLNIGYKNKPWAIWILDKDENPHEVILEPGDGIIYRGCDLYHWRGKNVDSDDCSQVFIHYVDQDGPHAWAKDDANP